jgi:hypothetical protein
MIRQTLGLAACLALAFGSAASADDEGFTPLFNGKDLSGWVQPDDKTIFSVEDGEIVGRTKEGQLKKNEFLVTDKSYGDFILKVKVKVLSGNSGVQFRSEREQNGRVTGPQADAAEGYWGLFYEEGRRGILERFDEAKAKELAHSKDWNEFVITARGNHVTIVLNGTKVIDRVDPKFDKSGIIALQTHAGPPMEVHFKDITIKPID